MTVVVGRALGAIGLVFLLALVALVAALAAPFLQARELARWWADHPSGEGLSAWPYIQEGRDDLWPDFLGALLFVLAGLALWGLLLRGLAERLGWL